MSTPKDRTGWQTGVVRTAEDAAVLEQRFAATGEQGVQAVWDLVLAYLSMGEPRGPVPRLDRTVTGVRRG